MIEVKSSNSPGTILRRVLGIVRRPLVGPLLFGLIVGGAPFGVLLIKMGLTRPGVEQYFGHLTPIAVVVAAFGAALGVNPKSARLLRRAFLTSMSGCFLAPIVAYLALAWHEHDELLDIHNLPYALMLFGSWTLVATLLGWLLALVLILLHKKYVGVPRTSQ